MAGPKEAPNLRREIDLGARHYCPADREPMWFQKDTGREKIESTGGGFVCEEA